MAWARPAEYRQHVLPRRDPPPPPPEQEVSVRWRISQRDLAEIASAMESGKGVPVKLRVKGELVIEFSDGREIEIRARLSVARPRPPRRRY